MLSPKVEMFQECFIHLRAIFSFFPKLPFSLATFDRNDTNRFLTALNKRNFDILLLWPSTPSPFTSLLNIVACHSGLIMLTGEMQHEQANTWKRREQKINDKYPLTIHIQILSNDSWRVSWYLTLVCSFVLFYRWFDFQSPIARILKLNFVTWIAAISVHSNC